MRLVLRGLLGLFALLLVGILGGWGFLVWKYSDVAGEDVPKWQLALFIADEVGARVYCAVTGCPPVLPGGMTLREWATQALVPTTPVAIDVDPWGRIYVAEGDRALGGAEDNRRHSYWLEDDLASTSVEERRAYYEKWVAAGRIEDKTLFTKRADRAYVLEDANGDGTAYLGLARVLAQQGQADGAERALLQAVTIEPTSVKNRLALFSFHVSQQEFDKAEAEIRKIIADNPGRSDLLITMGNFFLSLNRNSESEAAYQKAIEADPKSVKPYIVMAGFYSAAGQKDKTLSMYLKALEIEPENVSILHAVARFHLDQGDLEAAGKEIAKALQKRPNYFPARMLSELLVAQREFPAAVELLNQLIQEEPKSARSYYFHHKFGKIWADRTIPKLSPEEHEIVENWAAHCFQTLLFNLVAPHQMKAIYEEFGLDPQKVMEGFQEIATDEARREHMKESTYIFRVLVKTLWNAGIITERTKSFYGMYVDFEEFKAEGDEMVGDAIAEDGIRYLQTINFGVNTAALGYVKAAAIAAE